MNHARQQVARLKEKRSVKAGHLLMRVVRARELLCLSTDSNDGLPVYLYR